MPRPKSHLFVTPVPIRAGCTLTVYCGDEIAHALPVYVGEDAATVAVTCGRCQKATVAKSEQVRLFYALVNGQEAKLEGTMPEVPKSQLCAACGTRPWIWDLKCEECLDATTAPSQPAGARWLLAHRDEMFALACAFDEARLAELMDAFLAEQIAALTDKLCRMQDDIATIVSTHRADWSWNDVVADVKGLAAQTAAKDAAYEQLSDAYTKQVEHTNFIRAEYQERLRAAERERDSLREALTELVYQVDKRGNANMLLAYGKATALLATLKAGKRDV